MATMPSDFESLAYDIVRGVLDVDVVHVDDNKVAGHFDALITYRDGRQAALEVTTLADPRALEMNSFPSKLDIPDATGIWIFEHPGHVNMKMFRQHVPTLVRWCEMVGVTAPFLLPVEVENSAPMRWLRRSRSRLDRKQSADVPARVYLMAESISAMADSHLRDLSYWIEDMQAYPWFEENQAKLARSGLTEQHLFVRLHNSVVPWSIFQGLLDAEDEILAEPPEGMKTITDLWLIVGSETKVTHWSSSTGWSKHSFELSAVDR